MKINKISPSIMVLCLSFLLILVYGESRAQIPINPLGVPQFVDPLPHFAYPGARVDVSGGGALTISMEPHQQVALSTGTVLNGGTVGVTPGVGMTSVWAYKISDGVNSYGPLWPAHTIETRRGVPLNVTYVNNLHGETYANVGLTVDQTLHWADGLGQPGSFAPYAGEPPTVVHLHGGEVSSLYDGGPDAWFTPGNAVVGPAWDYGVTNDYQYLNTQEPATLWFHDHVLGATRLNVYAGMAGFYFLKDNTEDALHLPGWSGDNMVQEVDRATGTPVGTPYTPEIEIVIQDRMFDTNGQLFFPNLPPNPTVHPFWTPEFEGDIITVNGKTWPYLSVAPRKYRFRLLNGSNARFYELWLQDLETDVFGPIIYQVGTDGGLLDAPVPIDPNLGQKLLLGPGERADVIVDFSATPNAVWTLRNSGRTPFPKGVPPTGATLGRIMQFVVNGQLQGADNSQLPASLRPTPMVKLTDFAGTVNVNPSTRRQLTLNEVIGPGGPLEVLVNNTKWDGNGNAPGLGVTEVTTESTSEIWEIINVSADSHPIHLHLVQFQLVSRQKFNLSKYLKVYNAIPGEGPPNPYNTPNADGALGGNPAITPYLQGPPMPANANERGWKDTFIMNPGEVTKVAVRWAPTDVPLGAGQNELLFAFDPSEGPGYAWHCHIIDHEDNEMMRPYHVNASPARMVMAKANSQELTEMATETPGRFVLDQNYPNPFNPSTTVRYHLPEKMQVTISVYNMFGQKVATLTDGVQPSGTQTVHFNASGLASGMYFYQVIAQGNNQRVIENKSMLLIK